MNIEKDEVEEAFDLQASSSLPQMKREVAIAGVFNINHLRRIDFYSTADAVIDFMQFGYLQKYGDGTSRDKYSLYVDPRYDFDEVVKYMENYGIR